MNVWFHNKILQIHLQKCDPYVNLSDIKIVDAEGTIGKVQGLQTMARRLQKKIIKNKFVTYFTYLKIMKT